MQAKIRRFLGDHHRHLDALNRIATDLGLDAPTEGDIKQYLMTGKVAKAQVVGNGAILKAIKTNEDNTVAAYERAKAQDEASPDAREVFERAHEDELRHRSWMESAA